MNNKIEKFQFTPLREGRRCLGHASFALTAISIHAPPRGATFYEGSMHKVYTISIHAPPRGATFCMWYTPSIVVISIHAPPRGATFIRTPMTGAGNTFQFTPLREGRRPRLGKASGMHLISIHAPPRGATNFCAASADTFEISIHAPPRGAT